MSKLENLKDEGKTWWSNLTDKGQGIFIGMAIVLVLLGVSSLVGCPSRTMSVIEKKIESKGDSLDQKAAEKIEKTVEKLENEIIEKVDRL